MPGSASPDDAIVSSGVTFATVSVEEAVVTTAFVGGISAVCAVTVFVDSEGIGGTSVRMSVCCIAGYSAVAPDVGPEVVG